MHMEKGMSCVLPHVSTHSADVDVIQITIKSLSPQEPGSYQFLTVDNKSFVDMLIF
jgi:hypothetical protein